MLAILTQTGSLLDLSGKTTCKGIPTRSTSQVQHPIIIKLPHTACRAPISCAWFFYQSQIGLVDYNNRGLFAIIQGSLLGFHKT
jgi:hypothetical protein